MDEELLNDYLEEVSDIMERVETVLENLQDRSPELSDIDELFRSIHTVKGGAGMFSWENTQNTGHTLETYLGECKKNITSFDFRYVRKMVDKISKLLENNDEDTDGEGFKEEPVDVSKAASDGNYQSLFFTKFVEDFSEILAGEEARGMSFFEFKLPGKAEVKFFEAVEKYGVEKFSEETEQGKKCLLVTIPTEMINDLLLTTLSKLEGFNKVERSSNTSRPDSTIAITNNELKKKSKEKAKVKSGPSEMLRVPLTSVNDALNNIWEVFLLRNQMSYLFEKNKIFLKGNPDMAQEWELMDNALKRNITELETTAMSMRMNDLSSLFSRMRKVVRSYAESSNKEIEFITEGDDISLIKKL